jgi:hypothetical protein
VTAIVAGALVVLAILDGTFSGFRSSLGRTGKLDHRRSDVRAALRGGALVGVLLAPLVALTAADVLITGSRLGTYDDTGQAMLLVYAPYAALVLLALGAYFALGWQQRYLASAMILGPFTLLRPAVAVAGAIVGIVAGTDVRAAVLTVAFVAAVLAVEPLADRFWYGLDVHRARRVLTGDAETGAVLGKLQRDVKAGPDPLQQ